MDFIPVKETRVHSVTGGVCDPHMHIAVRTQEVDVSDSVILGRVHKLLSGTGMIIYTTAHNKSH